MDSISFGGENGHSSKQKEKFSDEEIIKIYKKIIPNSSRRELLSEIIEYPLVVLINNVSLRTVMASEVFSYMKEVQQCTEKDATLFCLPYNIVYPHYPQKIRVIHKIKEEFCK